MDPVLNILSLVLGLMSWLMAMLCISINKSSKFGIFSSFLFCGGALLLVLYQIRNLIAVGDISALADTIQGYVIVGSVLLIVTFLLNCIVLFKGRRS